MSTRSRLRVALSATAAAAATLPAAVLAVRPASTRRVVSHRGSDPVLRGRRARQVPTHAVNAEGDPVVAWHSSSHEGGVFSVTHSTPSSNLTPGQASRQSR